MKRNYYHQHERAYQGIQKTGGISWGNIKEIKNFINPDIEFYLKRITRRYYTQQDIKTALDMGCGTGPNAHILFDLGYQVTAIDISDTALQMGRELAAQHNKKIQFQNQDILTLSEMNQLFDLIYDSHCMHCIVLDEDRKKAFSEIRKSLSSSGIFALDTMVYTEGHNLAGGMSNLKFDENYILWHQTQTDAMQGIKKVDGTFWCPQRRVYPFKTVRKELVDAGFIIIEECLQKQNPGDPDMYRVLCCVDV